MPAFFDTGFYRDDRKSIPFFGIRTLFVFLGRRMFDL
jgi:hypothetical protein